MRFVIVSIFRSAFVAPILCIYFYRHSLEYSNVHLSILVGCLVSPTIAFSIHGYVLKKCGLEIQTDFITKNEDPCQDAARPKLSGACKLGVEETWKPIDEDYIAGREEVGDSNDFSIN